MLNGKLLAGVAGAAFAAGAAAGAWGAWQWQAGRVELAQALTIRAESERDRLSEAVADRDRALVEYQRSQRLVTEAVQKCVASVRDLQEQAARQESTAATLRSEVRRDLEPIREAIARLGPQNPPAGADCAAEFARWRAEGR